MDQDEVKRYYDQEIEKSRLELDHFKLEGIRTKEIIQRFLTGKEMAIADVGGGAGFYSFWLASLGHRVTLVDLSPGNIALVNEFSRTSYINLNRRW
jgi:2-polyprenyl-3-methyl-5-hydroxy-6-metoxy-1,4-benzoquinol methylase